MSALPLAVLDSLQRPVPEAPSPHALRALLVQELQRHARGVTRSRRARLHQQFAREWRGFAEAQDWRRGWDVNDPNGLRECDYPLLKVLHNQAVGAGKPILYK